MSCREFSEFLMEYLAGKLSPTARTVFEQHMADCPDCVTYLRTYQATIRLEVAAFVEPDRPVSGEVPEDLVRAILAARKV